MEHFDEAWSVICDYCRRQMTDVAYNTWISKIEPVNMDFDKRQATLLVPNDFHRQTLERCYKILLKESFNAVFDTPIDINFIIPSEEPEQEETTK